MQVETEVAQRDAMAFAGLRTGQKKNRSELNSISSKLGPWFHSQGAVGRAVLATVYRWGGDMGQEVSTNQPC